MQLRTWVVQFVQKYCYTFRLQDETTRIISPHLAFKKSFKLLDAYKINVCIIEGNLHAPISGIMCHLNDPSKFASEDLNVNTESQPSSVCGINKVYGFMNHSGDENQINEWLHLAVTREPIDRFVHAFASRCISIGKHKRPRYACNECQSDIACFIYREYNRMLAYSHGRYSTASVEDRIFFPQNWRCDFKNRLKNYKILRHYNINDTDHSIWDEIFGHLQERGVNLQNLNFLKSQVYSGLSEPDGFLEIEQRLLLRVRDDPQLMKMLYRMYFHDFVMFGYKLPEIG